MNQNQLSRAEPGRVLREHNYQTAPTRSGNTTIISISSSYRESESLSEKPLLLNDNQQYEDVCEDLT